MKRIVLLFLGILLVSSAFAHEVMMNYFILGYNLFDDGPGMDEDNENDAGFALDQVRLCWYAPDYGFEFGVYDVFGSQSNIINIKVLKAMKKFDLYGYAYLTIGYDNYAFGRIYSGKGSKNINIFPLPATGSDWMFKLNNNIGNLGWTVYLSKFVGGSEDDGIRLTYNLAGVQLGAALMLENRPNSIADRTHYEVDFEYPIAGILNLAGQVTNNDDRNDDTADLDFYVIAHCLRGFEFPHIGGANNPDIGILDGVFKPYVGYVTKRDAEGEAMGENNILIGINFTTYQNAYFKLEYNMDSVEDVDDTLTMQFGYSF